MSDLFDRPPERGGAAAFQPGFATEDSGIELFEATLIGRRRTSIARGHSLFEGFDALKVITFSSSVPAILSIVELFEDVEITFGSERILARELAALEQASTLDAGYRFVDAVADQKAFIERFVRPALSKGGRRLLQRVLDGTLRFRMLRGLPSHEKLYLMSGNGRRRALLGSANLSIPALRGHQKETFIGFDRPEDYEEFLDYYTRDVALADPIDAEFLVVPQRDGADPEPADDPVEPTDVPAIRVLKAGAAIVEEPRRAARPGFSAAALREAERHGAELRSLVLDRNRSGAVVVTAEGFRRAYRAHQSKPIQDATEHVPRAVIDLEAGLVTLDRRPWHRLGSPVPWPEVQRDAELLKPYFDGFSFFYGDAAGLQQSYWALTCWLYAAPFAPLLRSATVRYDGSPLNYPVHAVLYGRSDGGKTMFSRVMSRSMFRVDKMIRAHEFTAKKAFGLRDMLGAIPLIVDDVNRDRFTSHVPDLVKFDHEVGERYAPILISTNRDVTAVAPELGKRMVVCAIHGARPRSLSEVPARRALSGIGTALYRAFLDRLAPVVPDLVARVADDPLRPPDLIRSSSEMLADLLTEALGETPAWARQIGLEDLDRLKDKPFLDQLRDIEAQNRERVAVSRTTAELTVNFAGDHLQASRFEKLVPAQALKGRLADTVKLDLAALEKEYGFALGRSRRSWLARLLGR